MTFVWTVRDVLGIIALALVVLAVMFVIAYECVRDIRAWWRTRKNK